MSKVAIVFWSATGNTETMANCIAEGAGAAATIVPCAEMDAAKLGEYDVVAFGCPAMGAEQLEESEFEPMFAGLEGSLNGKKVALFGSYGWGDGQVRACQRGRRTAVQRRGPHLQRDARRRRSGCLPQAGRRSGQLVKNNTGPSCIIPRLWGNLGTKR